MPDVIPILISGKQGSGKSSTAKALAVELGLEFHVATYRFADPLYRMHDAVLNIMRELGIEVPKKDGRLLQLLGTEWGRAIYGQDVWVNCALGYLKNYRKTIHTFAGDRQGVLIIDDCRFKNEFEAFSGKGLTFRLEAEREARKGRTESWREIDDHQSETDLDDWLTRFDNVFRTDVPEVTTEVIVKEMAGYLRDLAENGRYD